MMLNELLLEAMNREVDRSRWALEQVPEGLYDWKPHDKSMIFGYLAELVAVIPTWITGIVTQSDIDVAPTSGPSMKPEPKRTSAALIAALDQAANAARDALAKTTDEHLHTSWQLKAAGKVVLEAPRYQMVLDTLTHWAHHRGQMTVYLRLMGAKVPAMYGPSSDDPRFA